MTTDKNGRPVKFRNGTLVPTGPKHRTSVAECDPSFAHCHCGWIGPDRRYEADAVADAKAHREGRRTAV